MIKLKRECDHQPVMLEQQHPDGTWHCMTMYSDGTPKVFDCGHEAFEVIIEVVTTALTRIALGELPPSVELGLEQFRLVPCGPAEPPIEGVAAAQECLSKFMEKKDEN